MQRRTFIPHRITCSHLLIILVLLGAAVVASQVLARPDPGSTRSATSMYQENNAKLVYSPAWKAVRNAKCFNGLMRKRSGAGSVTAAFTGTGVSVYVTKGPAYGIMNVTLDGVAQKSVSLYAAANAYKRKAFSRTGLANGTHILKLAWAGKKVAAASGRTIDLDALGIQGRLIRVPTPPDADTDADGGAHCAAGDGLPGDPTRVCATFGAWTSESNASCSGGTQRTVNAPGAAVIDFTGTQAYVVASKGPGYGTMSVTLDGAAQPNVDLSAATAKYQQVVFSKTGLTDAAHRLVIERAAGKINLDAVDVLGTLTQAPDFTGGLVGFWCTTPEYDWVESWKFRADGTYTYLVSNGSTTVREDGLYAAYQGASSKLLLSSTGGVGVHSQTSSAPTGSPPNQTGLAAHRRRPEPGRELLVDAGDVAANMARSDGAAVRPHIAHEMTQRCREGASRVYRASASPALRGEGRGT